MIVPFIQLANILNDAGFPGGTAQLNGIAIVCAESGRDTAAKHVNADGSTDRGLWQINDKFHPEVTDAQAYDPVEATKAALRISSNGSNYGPWSTFTGGAYRAHLEAAGVALDGAHQIRVLNAAVTGLHQQLGALQAQLTSAQSSLTEAETELADAQGVEATDQQLIDSLKSKIAAAQQALS